MSRVKPFPQRLGFEVGEVLGGVRLRAGVSVFVVDFTRPKQASNQGWHSSPC